mmetsp:Transcript_90021/g.257416  ORF Transcript_90021/g.257416 Transcript_90021/m.257416 type:complete len:269 (-) Transcript_90021:517-1323(-)
MMRWRKWPHRWLMRRLAGRNTCGCSLRERKSGARFAWICSTNQCCSAAATASAGPVLRRRSRSSRHPANPIDLAHPRRLLSQAAAAQAGRRGSIRRCVTCRQAMCGCTTTLAVNVTLWSLIKILFPQDVASRQRSLIAEAAEARRARGGEDGGSHSRGYAVVEACAGVSGRGGWNNLGQWGIFGTRSMVLDAADKRMLFSLAVESVRPPAPSRLPGSPEMDEPSSSSCGPLRFEVNQELRLGVAMLTMEEDEVPYCALGPPNPSFRTD